MKTKISVVLPCHNEARNLPLLIPEIIKYIPKNYDYEIICVDDGSVDETANVIKLISNKNKKIKGILFHRNFGHQNALLAGIKKSSGSAIITMDADFQHPPKLLTKIIKKWENGHDMVQLIKNTQKGRGLTEYARKIGYLFWKWVSQNTIHPGASDFRLIDKKTLEYIINSSEREIFLRGIVHLAAKNPYNIKYNVAKRKFGTSSYNFKMFLNMFINGFISFSTFPLRLGSIVGFIITSISVVILGGDVLFSLISGQRIIQGYVTIIFLMLILNGFLIFYLGILGEYIGVIFREVKNRPNYIIDELINF